MSKMMAGMIQIKQKTNTSGNKDVVLELRKQMKDGDKQTK